MEIAQLAAAAEAVSWNEDAVGQEAALGREAAVGRVVKREAGVNCSTPNASYENVLQWWEKKEPTAQNTDGTEMEVDIHIAQLAAAADAVAWNVEEEQGPI